MEEFAGWRGDASILEADRVNWDCIQKEMERMAKRGKRFTASHLRSIPLDLDFTQGDAEVHKMIRQNQNLPQTLRISAISHPAAPLNSLCQNVAQVIGLLLTREERARRSPVKINYHNFRSAGKGPGGAKVHLGKACTTARLSLHICHSLLLVCYSSLLAVHYSLLHAYSPPQCYLHLDVIPVVLHLSISILMSSLLFCWDQTLPALW